MVHQSTPAVKIHKPTSVLDLKTLMRADKHDEELHCAANLSLAAMVTDHGKLRGKTYEVHNYLYVRNDTMEKVKLGIAELNLYLSKYPFFKGSDKTPHIFGINIDKNKTVSDQHLIDLVQKMKPQLEHAVVNHWLLLPVDGSHQAVFCGRSIREDLLNAAD